MKPKTYDYIFTGGGLAAQLLVYRLTQDAYFKDHRILIIDAEEKSSDDRTWCFWDTADHEWSALVDKSWNSIYFGHPEGFFDRYALSPMSYHMMRSSTFYQFMRQQFEASNQVEWVQATVVGIDDRGDQVLVRTSEDTFTSKKVFSSIYRPDSLNKQTGYEVLQQHFVGWFVETPQPEFDDQAATFMDFSIPQRGNTRFMYILPESPTKALFEYTLFSERLLKRAEYEAAIADYLKSKHITEYTIIEKEQGCIPMSCYPFHKASSKNVLPIGTAGGWTKPSTGFTFTHSDKQAKNLTVFLKQQDDLRRFYRRDRFWYYDLLFIDVLSRKNELGAQLFSTLFKRNEPTRILRFLNNETQVWEELKITLSLPPKEFIKAVWNQLNKKKTAT
ncbi:lycopene cyclase family protein [Croceiramulus getboli]|nr:lycopene cyclase family protein [Flavobacteriaceae bacterium YJPT1-3]